jgi:dihydropteroate synthase
MVLKARNFHFTFPRPALVMGIVNVTPDSFSDGGQFLDRKAAVAHALDLVEQGADIIDVGGESTRPGATPVSEEEELDRVMPVVEGLAGLIKVPLSIDTMKPEVARVAIAAGADIVNDVAASRAGPEMWRLVAEAGVGYVCMHSQGTPQTMQNHPTYGDVVAEVREFFLQRLEQLSGCGVRPEQTILDPGIGFGKSVEHNVQLLGGLRNLARLERPMLAGVSRKSFLARVGGPAASGRLGPSLACACLAVEAGVQMIRAHDVAETVQALRMTQAILAQRKD